MYSFTGKLIPNYQYFYFRLSVVNQSVTNFIRVSIFISKFILHFRPSTESPSAEEVFIVEPEKPLRVQYTSIQRNRPSGQYEVREPDEEASLRPVATSPRYQTIERNRPAQPPLEEEGEERLRPKYSSIQRSRPTTPELLESTTSRLDLVSLGYQTE